MSLVKLVGFACVDKTFRQRLYDLRTADPSRSGFYLHTGDIIATQAIFRDPNTLEPLFNAILTGICTHPTCYAAANVSVAFGAMVLHEPLIDKFFADPVGFLSDHGFPFTVGDLSVLDSILEKQVQSNKLKTAFHRLAKEIDRRVGPLWKAAAVAARKE